MLHRFNINISCICLPYYFAYYYRYYYFTSLYVGQLVIFIYTILFIVCLLFTYLSVLFDHLLYITCYLFCFDCILATFWSLFVCFSACICSFIVVFWFVCDFVYYPSCSLLRVRFGCYCFYESISCFRLLLRLRSKQTSKQTKSDEQATKKQNK